MIGRQWLDKWLKPSTVILPPLVVPVPNLSNVARMHVCAALVQCKWANSMSYISRMLY